MVYRVFAHVEEFAGSDAMPADPDDSQLGHNSFHGARIMQHLPEGQWAA